MYLDISFWFFESTLKKQQQKNKNKKGFQNKIINQKCMSFGYDCLLKLGAIQLTSMKEIPTLQTSAWIPYCSPDILSGCKANKQLHIRSKLYVQKHTKRFTRSLTAMYAFVPTYVLAIEFTNCK